MKKLAIIFGVLVCAIILDGLVLPAIFHIYGGLLTFAFLVALLTTYGVKGSTLAIGIVCSVALELWYGFYLGSVVLSWLMAAVVWTICMRFLSINPYIQSRSSGTSLSTLVPLLAGGDLLITIMSISYILVMNLIYSANTSWSALGLTAINPVVWLVSSLGLVLCMLVFGQVDHQNQ